MKREHILSLIYPVAAVLLSLIIGRDALAHETDTKHPTCRVFTADRVFDGVNLHTDAAVLIKGNKVKRSEHPIRCGAYANIRST